MEFMIFYASVIVLATVASAPVEIYRNLGISSGINLCDSSNGDCSLIPDNGHTISSADLNLASGGAGAWNPFMPTNLFTAANSGSSEVDGFITKSDTTPNQIPPQTGSDSSILDITRNLQSQAQATARPLATYDCPYPPQVPGRPDDLRVPAYYESTPPYGLLLADKPADDPPERKLPVEPVEVPSTFCIKCDGPKESDCRKMIADCDEENPYQCQLCYIDEDPNSSEPSDLSCEQTGDISRLPSKANPYGQSWCKSKECIQCPYGIQSQCPIL